MCLKKKNNLPDTFQFRLTLYYSLLTTLALLTLFGIGHLLLHRQLQADTAEGLRHKMEWINERYLGETTENSAEKVSTNDWPAAVAALFRQTYPQLRIGLVERQDLPDGIGYEVVGSTGSERIEVLLANGQTWISHREPLTNVFGSIAETMDKGGLLMLISGTGSPPLGRIDDPDAETLLHGIGKRIGAERWVQLVGKHGRQVIAWRLFDGNILCLAADARAASQVMRRWGVLFLWLVAIFIPVSAAVGWLISGHAMAGVKRITVAAQAVEAGRLRQSVQSRCEGREIEALANAFNSMTDRIDRLVKEVKSVTANVAHDMRTPLTRIRTMMETTDWSRAPEAERIEIAALVGEECDRLAPLINDILELSQAEAGMLALRTERFDLAEEIRKALQLFSILAEEKQVAIEDKMTKQKLWISADRARIQRIFANLLDNAVKYTPGGGTISVRLREEQGVALLDVADNGPGIPAAERLRVFEPFFRLDTSRSTPGNGMGLSLAKAFAVAHGGDLLLSETIPHGCTVQLRLPECSAG